MIRKPRPLWSLETRKSDRTEPWSLVEADFRLGHVRDVQRSLERNFIEPHDFRIRRWERP